MESASELASQPVSESALRVLIAGGGTGGHVIPALAIARELRDVHGAEVRFVGTERGLETRLVPEAGFALELVRSGQLKNVSLATRLRTAIDLPLGALECMRLLGKFQPQVAVGVGGYASGPGMLAALLRRVPTLAFEPNAVPGLANRLVGRWVSAAAVNFEPTRRFFRNAHVTGIPVRAEFFAVGEKDADAPPRLLVFGGSQGARVFNAVMPRIAKALLEYVPGLTILHQAGARAAEKTAEAYRAGGADPTRWQVAEFLDEMPQRFAEADLILCRSGASTVAELAAAGRAAVLVPFPGAADDHQRKNADVFAEAGAAQLRVQVANDALMESYLLGDLSELLLHPQRRAEMAERVRKLARPNAAQEIATMVVELAHLG
ncbi:MAG: undecaprenyldiphospho-muramoylpentapeptide beta-N-acetylglucosaminyltransferase [Acidobacteriaceae bacterium]|nr:undecaprenyldiphospho-muramoylpentapeptide beta-N-acetylglucosaminyltransferase [Acidobacteriaceae bacterium]